MKRTLAQAKVLARIGGLAGVYGVDIDALHPTLSALGDEVSRRALVTVPHTFDRIAVTTRASRERVAAVIDAAQQSRLDRLAPDVPEVEIELESAGESACTTVRAPQSRPVEVVSRELEAIGAHALGLARLRQAGERLGRTPHVIADRRGADGSVRWTLHYRHPNADDAAEATRRRLVEVANALAVTIPQKSIIEGLHDVLAGGADSIALLSLRMDETVPTLAIRWHHVGFETVIRMMLGFYPGLDAGKRLGELAGALAADRTTAMELTFGVTEPPAMRIAVAL